MVTSLDRSTAKRKRRCFEHPGAHGMEETAALLSEVCLSGPHGIVAEAPY
jgi:hypothetical protein